MKTTMKNYLNCILNMLICIYTILILTISTILILVIQQEFIEFKEELLNSPCTEGIYQYRGEIDNAYLKESDLITIFSDKDKGLGSSALDPSVLGSSSITERDTVPNLPISSDESLASPIFSSVASCTEGATENTKEVASACAGQDASQPKSNSNSSSVDSISDLPLPEAASHSEATTKEASSNNQSTLSAIQEVQRERYKGGYHGRMADLMAQMSIRDDVWIRDDEDTNSASHNQSNVDVGYNSGIDKSTKDEKNECLFDPRADMLIEDRISDAKNMTNHLKKANLDKGASSNHLLEEKEESSCLSQPENKKKKGI